ncbi:MAG: hypothetical protein ISR58_12250 [Anaerolineales bacterium]|nr:hypothetical protein [Chloroflexota bacterium]MBL6981949.1 hypothetical protein [Anaerolineales bacterium]
MNLKRLSIITLALIALVATNLLAIATFNPVTALSMGRCVPLIMCGGGGGRRLSPPPVVRQNNPEPQAQPQSRQEEEQEEHEHRPQSNPAPPSCTPTYAPPVVSLQDYLPPYPVVIGQDPEQVGVDVIVTALGGLKSNGCSSGPGRATISSITLDGVDLSAESRGWITGELAQLYPGAHIKDSYPLRPSANRSVSGMNATLRFHLDPRDPGTYLATVTVRQSDGRMSTRTFEIPVHLLDGTITW